MTEGLLLDVPADGPPALDVARARLAAAQDSFETVDIATSHGLTSFRGEYIKEWLELCNARHCVRLLESLEIGRRK